MAGRFFDEWQVGDTVAHAVTRTVTETDNVLVSALTHNPQPMHLDHEAAAASEFGRPLVNSIYTFGLMVGVSVSDTTLGTLVANLGYDKLVFPAPVFVGDTLRSKRMPRGARLQVAPRCRHRHLGAPQLQPARRKGLRMHPLGAAQEEAGMTLMPPRSWLFVPADSEKKIAKALDSEADAIIFDLEDSVAADRKAARARCSRRSRRATAGRAGGCGSTRSAASISRPT
jgi:acyl dehydratase